MSFVLVAVLIVSALFGAMLAVQEWASRSGSGLGAGKCPSADGVRSWRLRNTRALERIADHEAPAGELAGEAVAHADSGQGDAVYLPHRADA